MLHVPFKNNRSLIIIAIKIKKASNKDKPLKDLHKITMTEAKYGNIASVPKLYFRC